MVSITHRLSANTGGQFPAALQDALTSYAYLIFNLAILPSNIILSGDSAGGHMALQPLRYISDHGAEFGLPPPQCAWLRSPWCDAGPPLLDPTVVYKVPQYARLPPRPPPHSIECRDLHAASGNRHLSA